MEILETFPQVFGFPKLRINENGGNKLAQIVLPNVGSCVLNNSWVSKEEQGKVALFPLIFSCFVQKY